MSVNDELLSPGEKIFYLYSRKSGREVDLAVAEPLVPGSHASQVWLAPSGP